MTTPQYQDPHQVLWSDKSKIIAGLLQIIPGIMIGLGGIGRLYAGHRTLGFVQLMATVFGWIAFFCSFALIFTIVVFVANWIWFLVDGVVLLLGRPVDGRGRPMRS